MTFLSVVINVDSRPTFLDDVTATSAVDASVKSGGTRSVDYMIAGVENKLRFLEEYEKEVIVFVDLIEPLPPEAKAYLDENLANGRLAKVIYSRHDERYDGNFFPYWNDITYAHALVLARGTIIVHFDGDTAAFKRDRRHLDAWIGRLERGEAAYICNPSKHSPGPVDDPNFDYRWASTRFFMARRESFDFSEVMRCLRDSTYLYRTYGDRKMKCPWLEHILGLMAKQEVWYPPRDDGNLLVFCWARYRRGTLAHLNSLPFDEVARYVARCGGIQYPCDVLGA